MLPFEPMAAPGPTLGAVFGNYLILRKLGQGGMGVVYLAEDLRLNRQVALKTLAREYAEDPERRKRLLNEARAAAALNHPGVAAVYGLEECGEDIFIIFEYVEGTTLSRNLPLHVGGRVADQSPITRYLYFQKSIRAGT